MPLSTSQQIPSTPMLNPLGTVSASTCFNVQYSLTTVCTMWRTQDSLTSKQHMKPQHLQYKASASSYDPSTHTNMGVQTAHNRYRVAPSNKHTVRHMRAEENLWSGTAGQSPQSRISVTACASVQFSTVSKFAQFGNSKTSDILCCVERERRNENKSTHMLTEFRSNFKELY